MKMTKRVVIKDDGRYLIYYHFKDKESVEDREDRDLIKEKVISKDKQNSDIKENIDDKSKGGNRIV